ncbi:MAG: hypothetical protein WA989_00595, partial [Henriciella sp.]|uniref:hypothetical protein n=1 Tax=Henriciella sp. TaxID=1968823 RepID=UPI003C7308B4
RVMSVMGMRVVISGALVPTAPMFSPTIERTEIFDGPPSTGNGTYNVAQWFVGDVFPGRKQPGFIAGTAIILGEYDPDYLILNGNGNLAWPDEGPGALIASEVNTGFENVALGLVTDSICSTPSCDAAVMNPDQVTVDLYLDWYQANNNMIVVPILDPRLRAAALRDEGGFLVDVSETGLTGREFGTEGYFGDIKSTPVDLSGDGLLAEDGSENVAALHYWITELTGFDALALANPDVAEIEATRVSCDPDQLEVRGAVHSPVDELGVATDGGAVTGTRVVQVWVDPPAGGDPFLFSQSTPADIVGATDPAVANDPFGIYRLRDRAIPFCPDTIELRWVDLLDPANPLAVNAGVVVDVAPA